MNKSVANMIDEEQIALEEIHERLAEENSCYVLITCKPPDTNGNMHIEMTYEGDPSLASYLIESAQGQL